MKVKILKHLRRKYSIKYSHQYGWVVWRYGSKKSTQCYKEAYLAVISMSVAEYGVRATLKYYRKCWRLHQQDY